MSATILGFSRAAAIASGSTTGRSSQPGVRSKFTWRLAQTKPGTCRMVSFVARTRKSSSPSGTFGGDRVRVDDRDVAGTWIEHCKARSGLWRGVGRGCCLVVCSRGESFRKIRYSLPGMAAVHSTLIRLVIGSRRSILKICTISSIVRRDLRTRSQMCFPC
jgi:hypothetical protein